MEAQRGCGGCGAVGAIVSRVCEIPEGAGDAAGEAEALGREGQPGCGAESSRREAMGARL